jgi:hypothetical protein
MSSGHETIGSQALSIDRCADLAASFLDAESLVVAALVNRSLAARCAGNEHWEPLFQQKWPTITTGAASASFGRSQTGWWRKRYIACYEEEVAEHCTICGGH